MKTVRQLAALMLVTITANAQQGPPPSPVSVAEVKLTTIVSTVPVSGTIFSRNDIQVTSGVDGQLLFVAEPGARLKKGEAVARLDDTQLKLQLLEQEQLAKRARSQLKFLNSQLERQKSLLSTNSTSANQMEQTESDRDVAASDLRIAEVRMKQIQDQLDRTVVEAPFNGVVIERLRRGGEDISRGAILARIMDTENLEVRAFVPLKYSTRVRAGDDLRVFGFESEYGGKIRTIVPSADTRSQTIELRVDLNRNAKQAWTAGQLVSVAIPMRSNNETLAIPRDALVLRQDGTYVFRVDNDNKVQRISIEVGDSQGDLVAISGGLSAGDQVAIRGAESLRDGQSVRVMGGGSFGRVSEPGA
ncbi:MAG: efflux RND transporter periplasmic adaptor subunit [Pseudomonadota bacterium]